MNAAELEATRSRIEREVRARFPDGTLRGVGLLEHGDGPVIEPGELLVRVFLEPDPGGRESRDPVAVFEDMHRKAMKKLRRDLAAEIPEIRRLEVVAGEGEGPEAERSESGPGGGALTPVMARLGPVDLETLDALITAGIASSRADAVRWALARIRERPAYGQLRERALEIQKLRTEF